MKPPSIFTRESFSKKYLSIWNKHHKSITETPQNHKTTNKYAKELSTLYKTLIYQKKIFFLIDILRKEPETQGGISLNLSMYEPELGKRLYTSWYQADPDKHWIGKFRLENWDNLKDETLGGIEKDIKEYTEWKESNPREYEEFINNLKHFINS